MPTPANPFRSLADVEPGILCLAIANQRPATIALVLSRLPEGLAVQVAGKLGRDLRGRVLRCLAHQEQGTSDVIADVAQAVEERVREIEQFSGPARAARILSECQPALESSLLRSLDQRDEELSVRIRQTLFTFDDIAWLSDHSIQTLLRNIDLKTWAMALKRASEAIKQKITRNLSRRAARQLFDEIDYLGFASRREVDQAKQRIAVVARHLRQPAASLVA